MNTIQIIPNYGCQEITGAICYELTGGNAFVTFIKKAKDIGELVIKIVQVIDTFISDFGPSFAEGFREGWEAAG